MSVLFNILVVLLVFLIAYWWANHGLFSALLHLVCVVVAGAIAFAFWEPLTVRLLLNGNWFDDYAWGVALIGLFAVSLVVLRVAMDKLIPANVNLPVWANLTFGFPVGAAAGVLTIGITFIGTGFIQSHKEVMGYLGYGRSARGATVERIGPGMWIPVHQWTNEFYNWLSVGSLYPTFHNTPLLHYNPDLYKQASLVRDSFGEGKGKLSLKPDGARIKQAFVDEQTNRHAVVVDFGAIARDFGEQLTLSRSQIRLICRSRGDFTRPHVIHPDYWSQETQQAAMMRFSFDDPTHYITSVPGRESASVMIEFPVPTGSVGRFIQIRGTRYPLPQLNEAPPGMIQAGAAAVAAGSQTPAPSGTGPDITAQISITNSIRPLNVSTNQVPGTLKHADSHLTEGEATFASGGDRPSRQLLVRGIHEPAGTRIVQIEVGRASPASLFGPVAQRAPVNARIALIDAQGHTYTPIGYIYEHRTHTTIKLDPIRLLPTLADLPAIPSSATTHKLRLLFNVTTGVTIVALKVGEETIGRCNMPIAASRTR